MTQPNLLTELTQIAAVAIQAISDLSGKHRITAEGLVATEMNAQDTKWGKQHHTALEWWMILTEEIGEAATEVSLESIQALRDDITARGVVASAIISEVHARDWLSKHKWSARQQQVVDKENQT